MKGFVTLLGMMLLVTVVAGNVLAQTSVVVNEAYSRGTAGNLDWVEVYNTTGLPIDISGYKIYDIGGQSGTKAKKLFPAGTTLPSLGFYAIITDTNTSTTGTPDDFGLSSGGDKVWLEDAAGTLIDSMTIPALGIDTSWARVPDGSDTYDKLSPATRGTANTSGPSVVVNEAYSRGTAGNLDWVEVYNTTGSPIDISGYKIYDIGGQSGTKAKKLFPAGTTLPALGFYAIITDTNTSTTGTPDDFGLGSGGDKVWLEDAAGTLIDSMTIPALGIDTSWARVPDGSDTYDKLSPATRGTANTSGPSVVVNEAYSRGTAGNLDWVEVYNATGSPIDISGYKIYDIGGQSGTKAKKLFPAGTTLPALGYYAITTDTNTSTTGTPDDFGLGSGGDKVWLEDAAGTLIDSMTIPALGIDTSWARVPDGSSLYAKLSPVTRGTTNGDVTGIGDEPMVATRFALDQNYPNPFNPLTTIGFSVPSNGRATLKVYNTLGQEVATLFEGEMEAGAHRLARFEPAGLSTGIYFARLTSGGQARLIKMMYVK